MPLYQFRCGACGREFDRFRPVTEAASPVACECGGEARKVFLPNGSAIQIPWRFRRHVDVTGLKSDLGSGPGCEVNGSWGHSPGQVLRSA